jgi:hypothetical protein
MIYLDCQRGKYRMWHYRGTSAGFAFTKEIEVAFDGRGLIYSINFMLYNCDWDGVRFLGKDGRRADVGQGKSDWGRDSYSDLYII